MHIHAHLSPQGDCGYKWTQIKNSPLIPHILFVNRNAFTTSYQLRATSLLYHKNVGFRSRCVHYVDHFKYIFQLASRWYIKRSTPYGPQVANLQHIHSHGNQRNPVGWVTCVPQGIGELPLPARNHKPP